MPCSRMPKCSVRPYSSPGNSLVAYSGGTNDGSPFIVVLLLSARSAEPPHSSGSTGASASSTLPDAARVAMPFGSAGELGQRVGPARRAACGVVSRSNSAVRSGLAAAQASKRLLPRGVRRPAALDHLAGVGEHLVGDGEALRRVEAEDLLGGGDLVGAERRAVDLAGVLLVRRRPADDRAQRDERRPVGLRLGRLERRATAPRRPRGSRPRRRARPASRRSARASRTPRSGPPRPRTWRCGCRPRSRSRCRRRSTMRLPSCWWPASELTSWLMPSSMSPSEHDRVDVVVERARARRGAPGRTGRARGGRPSPCRPRCRGPGRAGRWWSRRRGCARARGGPGSASPTAAAT